MAEVVEKKMTAVEELKATGTLSWAEFRRDVDEFLALSAALRDGWARRTIKEEEPGQMYLEKKTVTSSVTDVQVPCGDDEDHFLLDENIGQDDDPYAAECSSRSSFLVSEFHIVYSSSYTVPTLFFNFWHQDGRLLSLEEVWTSVVPAIYQHHVADFKWNMLTQQEHPVLNRPFYHLHPCHTAELMVPFERKLGCNYLVTWLSAIGPVVGLQLSLAYALLLRQKAVSTPTQQKMQQQQQKQQTPGGGSGAI